MPDFLVSDVLTYEEDIQFSFHPNVNVYDDVVTSESFEYAKDLLAFDAYDIVSVLIDIVFFGFTPKYINVIDNASIIEYVPPPDTTETGISVEVISVGEHVSIRKDIKFNDLLRSYPFVERNLTGVQNVSYDNGVVQQRDTWGRTKKLWEITSPPLTKAEADDWTVFHNLNVGSSFDFTNPLDGITYKCIFVEREFTVTRRAFNTFFARLVLEEYIV